MRKFIANFIAMFIPFPRIRRKVRAGVLRALALPEGGAIMQRLEYLEALVKAQADITKIPPARGNMKMVQDCALSVLAVFAPIAKKHGLRWWLEGGALVGYFRHNGLVPWDDDIDIMMMRDDYARLLNILDKEFCKDGFFYRKGEITQLFYKNTPAQLDIFPMDSGQSAAPPTGAEYDEFVRKLNMIKSKVFKTFDYQKLVRQEDPIAPGAVEQCLRERDEILVPKKAKDGFIFYGVETGTQSRVLFPYADIFPLQPTEFMGIEAYIPNNADYYLFLRYGDFMNWPSSFAPNHSFVMDRLTRETFKDSRYLIANYHPQREKNDK